MAESRSPHAGVSSVISFFPSAFVDSEAGVLAFATSARCFKLVCASPADFTRFLSLEESAAFFSPAAVPPAVVAGRVSVWEYPATGERRATLAMLTERTIRFMNGDSVGRNWSRHAKWDEKWRSS